MPSVNLRLSRALLSLSILLVALAVPATAGANVSSEYPTGTDARDFAGSVGGWSASTSTSSCVLAVTCPTVTNSFQATGGADGDGFIRSAFQASLVVAGSATAIWQSPGFEYTGAGGAAPTGVSLGLSRRADVGDLVSVTSSTTYSVDLVDTTEGGAVIPVAGPLNLAGAEGWTAVPAASLNPSLLTIGHTYAVRISSTYTPGTVSVLVTGNADYDDVVLTATRPDSPPADPDGPGDDSGDDDSGKNSSDTKTSESLSTSELLTSVLRNTQETAAVSNDGSRVFVNVACPRRVKRACRISAQGRIGKKLRVTRRSTVRVASGRAKMVALQVKPRFRQRVAARKRLVVVQQVRAGKVSTTFARSRVLLRRG